MKKIFIMLIAVVAVILISGCQQTAKPNQSINNQTNSNLPVAVTDPEIKCENSGGRWWNPCETGECFKCDCGLVDSVTGQLFNKLLVDGACLACTSDSQCGNTSCGQSRNQCKEDDHFCENGICKYKITEYGTFDGPKTHLCQNNKCTPIGEIIDNASGPEKDCLINGGTWVYMNNGCGDDCYDKSLGQRMCTQAFTWKCNCGDTKCWDGKQCVLDK